MFIFVYPLFAAESGVITALPPHGWQRSILLCQATSLCKFHGLNGFYHILGAGRAITAAPGEQRGKKFLVKSNRQNQQQSAELVHQACFQTVCLTFYAPRLVVLEFGEIAFGSVITADKDIFIPGFQAVVKVSRRAARILRRARLRIWAFPSFLVVVKAYFGAGFRGR